MRKRERVGLQPQLPLARPELELVPRALLRARDEQLPEPGRAERAHRVQPAVPAVEVAHHADRGGIRRPDRERDAGDAVQLARVRAEPLVELLVPPLDGEVDVELAERRQERVRVAEPVGVAGRVAHLQLVVERQLRARDRSFEDPAAVPRLELDVHRQHAHRFGVGPVRADQDTALRRVRAEDGVRVGELVGGGLVRGSCR